MIMVGMLFFSISPFFAQQTVTLGDAIRIAQSNSLMPNWQGLVSCQVTGLINHIRQNCCHP